MKTKILLVLLVVSIACIIIAWPKNVVKSSAYSNTKSAINDDNVASNKGRQDLDPKTKAKSRTPKVFVPSHKVAAEPQSRQVELLDVPSVNLDPSDLEESKTLHTPTDVDCIDLEYRDLFIPGTASDSAVLSLGKNSPPLEQPLPLLSQGNYDAVISSTLSNLKRIESIDVDKRYVSSYIQNFPLLDQYRRNLLLLALAYEFKGDYDAAFFIHELLYSRNQLEFQWFDVRYKYVQHSSWIQKSPEFGNQYNPTSGYEKTCNIVHEQTYIVSIDDVLKESNAPEEEKEDDPNKLRRINYLTTQAYRIRNECAKVVNPRLHFSKLQPNEVTIATRKSYARFMEFMERQYELKRQEAANASEEEEEAMSFLRKLAELPN